MTWAVLIGAVFIFLGAIWPDVRTGRMLAMFGILVIVLKLVI